MAKVLHRSLAVENAVLSIIAPTLADSEALALTKYKGEAAAVKFAAIF